MFFYFQHQKKENHLTQDYTSYAKSSVVIKHLKSPDKNNTPIFPTNQITDTNNNLTIFNYIVTKHVKFIES